ncbi:MAG: NADH-quinone oxidoreductase subunit M [Candidatus Brocadiia bacterium]
MEGTTLHLPLLMMVPIIGMLILMLVPADKVRLIRQIAVAASVVALAYAIYLAIGMNNPGVLNAEQFAYSFSHPLFAVGNSSILFSVGVDGLGMVMVLLTCLLFVVALIVSLNIENRVREYYAVFLMLEVGCIGVFSATDIFLFYIFWELILIPMFIIIAVWGGRNRQYASLKFILFTLGGSLFMLLGFIGYYVAGGSGDLTHIRQIASGSQDLLFWLVFIGLAVKIPLFPFHTWLPDAHTEAPTAGSIVLAGILLKLGTYGFLRVLFPLFPSAANYYAPYIAVLGVVSILYGAFLAMSQKDIKRMIASSSISHMGFVVLALSTLTAGGFAAGTLQMVNHGIITGGLFLLIGIIYDRTHLRGINDFGGLYRVMPFYYGIFLLFALASIGMPGLNGFVSEFLCLFSGFQTYFAPMPLLMTAAVFGVFIGVIYMLGLVAKVFSGPAPEKWRMLSDLDVRESVSILPLCFLVVFLGIAPGVILKSIGLAMDLIAKRVASM